MSRADEYSVRINSMWVLKNKKGKRRIGILYTAIDAGYVTIDISPIYSLTL